MMITNVYVDGFNLYYGAVKGTAYKWLNIDHLCRLLLPNRSINRIKYFTARVSARPNDPGQPMRQEIYLRALRTLPNLEIIFGHFLTTVVSMPLARCPSSNQKYASVVKTEEKGSDVNLATHLLYDGFKGNFQEAVLITNDSDLLEPIKIITDELKYRVGILNPHPKPSRALVRYASFIKQIRKGALSISQFPTQLQDGNGVFHKPPTW